MRNSNPLIAIPPPKPSCLPHEDLFAVFHLPRPRRYPRCLYRAWPVSAQLRFAMVVLLSGADLLPCLTC